MGNSEKCANSIRAIEFRDSHALAYNFKKISAIDTSCYMMTTLTYHHAFYVVASVKGFKILLPHTKYKMLPLVDKTSILSDMVAHWNKSSQQ